MNKSLWLVVAFWMAAFEVAFADVARSITASTQAAPLSVSAPVDVSSESSVPAWLLSLRQSSVDQAADPISIHPASSDQAAANQTLTTQTLAAHTAPATAALLDNQQDAISIRATHVVAGDAGWLDLPQLLALEDPGWQPLVSESLVNHLDQPIWLYVRLQWQQPLQDARWLQVAWPYLTRVEAHVRDLRSNEWVSMASAKSHWAGEHNYLPHVVPLIDDGFQDVELFLRVESPAKLIVPLKIWKSHAYESWDNTRTLWLGMFFGVLLAMAVYNFSLTVFVRDSSYGFYGLYVLSMLFYTLGVTGVGQTYVWSGSYWLDEHVYGVSSSLAFLCATLFIQRFLNLWHYGGWLIVYSVSLALFWGLMVLGYLIEPTAWLMVLEDIGAIASCFIAIATGIAVWRKGNVSAKYVTIAWSILIAATFLLMAGLSGLIPMLGWFQPFQNVGIVLETMLLSLALAEQINRERKQRQQAQEMSLLYYRKADEARIRALEVERQAKSQLEDQVDRRTRELRMAVSELEAVNAELDSRSKMDGLTGLANRRYFDTMLVREVVMAQQSDEPLCLIMGDIDHFKQLNDNYGHVAGDACLMMVASLWRDILAPEDGIVARFGGEELIAILPACEQPQALQLAERIRHAIEVRPCFYDGVAIRTSMSFGVLQVQCSSDPALLLKQVDAALYEAKHQGRNRVVCYSSLNVS
ncbi:sensor domain-containing diguanylate cyclase [Oceanobacter kriegii]|uniref:sensor domain-containing diguanylate cyclase n=1 Tax=Oceanobacter kriegii TaxID=64972 RepID=UPI0012EC9720|nr:diguanylate cyclase [Oceanobacter kriegii]